MEQNNQLELINQLASAKITTEVVSSEEFAQKYETLTSLTKYLADLKKTVDANIKEVIKERYYETGENSLASSSVKYTYIPSTTRETFNSKAFKADNPEVYKKYVKVSPVSDSLKTFKIKNVNSEEEGESK